jgi:uncharacterized protein (DUF934 family)
MSAADDDTAAPIWRNGGFEADTWTRLVPDGVTATTGGPLLVPLRALLSDPEKFLLRSEPLGAEVQAGESVHELQPYLCYLSLIALVFPKFHDGRSYSAARLLRERYGFKGELRATGDVLSDQIPLMRRCGIESFEVTHAPTRAALLEGRLPEMHRYYQPIPTAREASAGTRPWLRQPAE